MSDPGTLESAKYVVSRRWPPGRLAKRHKGMVVELGVKRDAPGLFVRVYKYSNAMGSFAYHETADVPMFTGDRCAWLTEFTDLVDGLLNAYAPAPPSLVECWDGLYPGMAAEWSAV